MTNYSNQTFNAHRVKTLNKKIDRDVNRFSRTLTNAQRVQFGLNLAVDVGHAGVGGLIGQTRSPHKLPAKMTLAGLANFAHHRIDRGYEDKVNKADRFAQKKMAEHLAAFENDVLSSADSSFEELTKRAEINQVTRDVLVRLDQNQHGARLEGPLNRTMMLNLAKMVSIHNGEIRINRERINEIRAGQDILRNEFNEVKDGFLILDRDIRVLAAVGEKGFKLLQQQNDENRAAIENQLRDLANQEAQYARQIDAALGNLGQNLAQSNEMSRQQVGIIQEVHQFIKEARRREAEERRNQQYQNVYDGFGKLVGLGQLVGSQELKQVGIVGQAGVKITKELSNMNFSNLGNIISSIGNIGNVVSIISTAISLLSGGGEDVNTLILKQLQIIEQKLDRLTTMVEEGLEHINQNQRVILNSIIQGVREIKECVRAHHRAMGVYLEEQFNQLNNRLEDVRSVIDNDAIEQDLESLQRIVHLYDGRLYTASTLGRIPESQIILNFIAIMDWSLRKSKSYNFNGWRYARSRNSADLSHERLIYVLNQSQPLECLGFLSGYIKKYFNLNWASDRVGDNFRETVSPVIWFQAAAMLKSLVIHHPAAIPHTDFQRNLETILQYGEEARLMLESMHINHRDALCRLLFQRIGERLIQLNRLYGRALSNKNKETGLDLNQWVGEQATSIPERQITEHVPVGMPYARLAEKLGIISQVGLGERQIGNVNWRYQDRPTGDMQRYNLFEWSSVVTGSHHAEYTRPLTFTLGNEDRVMGDVWYVYDDPYTESLERVDRNRLSENDLLSRATYNRFAPSENYQDIASELMNLCVKKQCQYRYELFDDLVSDRNKIGEEFVALLFELTATTVLIKTLYNLCEIRLSDSYKSEVDKFSGESIKAKIKAIQESPHHNVFPRELTSTVLQLPDVNNLRDSLINATQNRAGHSLIRSIAQLQRDLRDLPEYVAEAIEVERNERVADNPNGLFHHQVEHNVNQQLNAPVQRMRLN